MMVWVLAEATCEVAFLRNDAASIHINVRGLCKRAFLNASYKSHPPDLRNKLVAIT